MAGFSVSSPRLCPSSYPPLAEAFGFSSNFFLKNNKHQCKNISNNIMVFCLCAFCVFYLSENVCGLVNPDGRHFLLLTCTPIQMSNKQDKQGKMLHETLMNRELRCPTCHFSIGSRRKKNYLYDFGLERRSGRFQKCVRQ